MYLLGKTAVLHWNEKNLDTIPDVAGVYILRNAAKQIVFIGSAPAGRLYDLLLQHWNASDIPTVAYVECFQMATSEEAQAWGLSLITRILPITTPCCAQPGACELYIQKEK